MTHIMSNLSITQTQKQRTELGLSFWFKVFGNLFDHSEIMLKF
jgi:hypothetical protein